MIFFLFFSAQESEFQGTVNITSEQWTSDLDVVDSEAYRNLTTKLVEEVRYQSLPITTKFVSLNHDYGKVYSIQHYVISFVSDLRQVGGFLRVLRFPPPIKTDSQNIAEILLKVALNTKNQCPYKPTPI